MVNKATRGNDLHGDDDNLPFTMRSSSTPVSWLGSHTESVIAAMLGCLTIPNVVANLPRKSNTEVRYFADDWSAVRKILPGPVVELKNLKHRCTTICVKHRCAYVMDLTTFYLRSCLDQMKHDNSSRFIELGTDPENNIDDKSLRDAVLNFVIVGRDTTATTLSWAIYMIMSNDHVAEKLYAKLKALEKERAEEENVSLKPCETQDPESFDLRTKQFADLMTYDSLGKLYYLHVVITETRRLYPAIPQVFDAMAFFHEIEAKTLCRVQTAEKSKSKVCRYFLFANTLAVLAFDALCNAAIQKAEVSGHTF
ncbi:cytochrome P450 704B1 [Tanacetum coccineum]